MEPVEVIGVGLLYDDGSQERNLKRKGWLEMECQEVQWKSAFWEGWQEKGVE